MTDLVKHTIRCLNMANTFQTKLPEKIFKMEGMSGIKTRMFYNNICSLDRPIEYLEVGTWKGSSICSAMHCNPKCHGTVIENWSLFNGPKDEFFKNLEEFNLQDSVTVYEEDFFRFDISKLEKKIDIYLYDGCHEYDSHVKGITHIWPALADNCIIMVDDWSATHIRDATIQGLKQVGANVLESFEIIYTTDGSHTPIEIARREFWNGIGIFIVSKGQEPLGN